MSLPRSRPELPKTIYSWGSLWTPGGELTALLAGATAPSESLDPGPGALFLGQLARTLNLPGVFLPPQQAALDLTIPELFEARRVVLAEPPWGLPGVYLILGRCAATRWDRGVAWQTEPALFSDRLNCGGAYRDSAAWLALPRSVDDSRFTWRAEAAGLVHRKKFDGRVVCLGAFASHESQPLMVALLPWSRGKPPSLGWINVFSTVWAAQTGLRVEEASYPNSSWPVLTSGWFWSYLADVKVGDVEATRTLEIAVSEQQLALWHQPSLTGVELRLWHRPPPLVLPGPTAPWVERWKALWEALPASDLRLAWENVFVAQGEAVGLAGLTGRLPLALRSLLKPRVRHELDRAALRAALRTDSEMTDEGARNLAQTLAQALTEGRIEWSPKAHELFDQLIWRPAEAQELRELTALSAPEVVQDFQKEEATVIEETLRRLDPTDAALCLGSFPDKRWRRHVTARREAEIRLEAEYCQALERRGELSRTRVLDAWRCFHREWNSQKENRQKQ